MRKKLRLCCRRRILSRNPIMACTIAVSGKGGTGKTTIAALVVRYIADVLRRPVLAVDADPNANLGLFLGVDVPSTVADIREDILESRAKVAPGMSKERHIEYMIHSSILEADGFDILTMGRPEGPKCYCYVNHILRKYLDTATGDYPFVIIDNEAGMEHLSRRTTDNVDALLLVAESTVIGVKTAGRINELRKRLPILIKSVWVVLNKVPAAGVSGEVRSELGANQLASVVEIPYDNELAEVATRGASARTVRVDNPVCRAVGELVEEVLKEVPAQKSA